MQSSSPQRRGLGTFQPTKPAGGPKHSLRRTPRSEGSTSTKTATGPSLGTSHAPDPGAARARRGGGRMPAPPAPLPRGRGGARPEPERGCRPSGARRDIAAPKPCSCRKTPSVPARAGSPGPGTRDTHGPRFPAQRCGAGAGLTLCPRGCRAARAPPARSSRCPRRGRPEAAAGHGRAAPPPAPP